ncbi:hypothetical protein GYMLUDRAFT_48495 [Collybiopsis luxurians FD-317 M1]|uniref:Cysteine-rich protein 1 n=1 Tax=Collybiopsis luxurians FD-317 M1 TaxID=944289 RepID=A0A0D0C9F3_9AGAR|nr:hypothetical protein GYMLUDRAFT_48495 [Collybiopsis luxurians FD-317 M1]
MHPFGGTPKCPRCDKPVYLAEQVIGPGRRLYHKPCLACTICNKRLDSLSLLEHDQKPYCKTCHVKNFGTRDLRQANLPHREMRSPSLSPGKSTNGTPQFSFLPPSSPTKVRSFTTGNGYLPRLQPTRVLSPTSPSFPRTERVESPTSIDEEAEEAQDTVQDTLPQTFIDSSPPIPSNTTGVSQIVGGDDVAAAAALDKFANTLGRSNGNGLRPIMQTPIGTRYGVALGGGVVSHSTGKWGGNTPSCPKCGKSVYFAEQVKAVGKTWHKLCLRCTECNTSLDSTRLRDHEDTPLCSRCYNKLHGPQGNGYALLGKAGG